MAFGWITLALIYLLALFYVASWGERNTVSAQRVTSHPAVYAMALAIYCTAWTFFGSVGQATREQWAYLPILLGPVLVYVFGQRFLYKLTLVSKKLHINTIADFIASRYGKRQAVALLVTLLALLATIPYIALQIKAIGTMFIQLTRNENADMITFLTTSAIAVFAMYFGTRQTDVTEYRRGLTLAIAFESLMKLFALLCISIVALLALHRSGDLSTLKAFYHADALDQFYSFNFIAQTLMAAAAVVCLPRQFHIAVVDNLNLKHLRTAQWMFPLYLLAIALTIPVISAAGSSIFANTDIEADSYVLSLALQVDSLFMQIVVFIGGLSASTAMVIVATLALSTMISNDVVLPRVLPTKTAGRTQDVARTIRYTRRVVIAVVLFLAFIYHQELATSRSLHSTGLVAFSLVIQLIPAIVGGLYWKRGHAHGVYAGLICGIGVWMGWLVFPVISGESALVQNNDLLGRVSMYSLFANTLAYVVFSLTAKPRLIDRLQSIAFVSPAETRNTTMKKAVGVEVTNADLVTLLSTFMGAGRRDQLIGEFEARQKQRINYASDPSIYFINFCERALGGVIGAASAKTLIDSVLQGKKLDFTEVIHFFDDTAQTMQQNMTALITSLENIDQGISVIDKNLDLVAWNKQYANLYQFPDELLAIGTPVEKLIRYNALNGEFGPGDVDINIEKRMQHLRAGHYHKYTRQRSDGRVIEMIGNPLPGGGFVTSFTDITSYMEIQQALEGAKIDLEHRVKKRTEEIHSVNAELRKEIDRRKDLEAELIQARELAEEANNSKTRFLALASHDILQPLNAANLYASALNEQPLSNDTKNIVSNLTKSLQATESLIGTLLDIARLDQGRLTPCPESIDVKTLLAPLIQDYRMRAEEKGLRLIVRMHTLTVSCDPTYLYRIVQNLLSNAVKYTETGRILLTVTKKGDAARCRIIDTGIGLTEEEQEKIFDDFFRADTHRETGVGLGLGVVNRLCNQLGVALYFYSIRNKGTQFSFSLPLVETTKNTRLIPPKPKFDLTGLRALCVDDEKQNLDALTILLNRWNVQSEQSTDPETALSIVDNWTPHVLLIDYQLGPQHDGLTLINDLRARLGSHVFAVLITASHIEDLKRRCDEAGVHFMRKPVKPARLRTLLQRVKY